MCTAEAIHHIGSFDGKGDTYGKANRILEYERKEAKAVSPKERIKNFNEFHTPLSEAEQRCQECKMHGLRCSVLPVRNEY